jgi:hypothetical protein
MSIQGIGLTALGVALAVANVVTVRSLWLSPIFEKSQKVAQSVLIWIVPGFFVVVRHLLREPSGTTGSVDPTTSRDSGYTADPTGYSHGHGDGDGGHHL